ncbi:PucR family transcriptional regulator [Micromonospora sp. NPDC050397]|uniref:PucR family transcriptional regulator n=1 Tax=Micromonospora sp. NPDC050397 TaxID=3364279 RepID=UPI00384EBED2
MGELFRLWRQRVAENARRAVDAYQEELLEYRNLAARPRVRSEMLDFAVFLRQRTVDLAADSAPFSAADLEFMAAMGRQRSEKGLTLTAQRQVLLLHTRLTLREVYEAAGPNDIGATMHTLAWLAPAGLAAQGAYTRGWIEGQERTQPTVARVQLLTAMLLADDVGAAELARDLHMPIPDHVLAAVVRVAGETPGPDQASRNEFANVVLRAQWMPLSWQDPHEVIALIPSAPGGQEAAADRGLALAREVANLVGRPCAVGTAPGRVHAYDDAVALARQVSLAAPMRAVPRHAYAVTDVFAELGAARLPEVEQWLGAVTAQLTSGPDLVATLDAYYQHDMNRLRTATALCIHPRTLDFRLARVRELTGLKPGSTRGVRVLSTAVARILASPLP